MKSTDKKEVACAPVQTPVPNNQKKETSGDKSFDSAIDKMLRPIHTPAK